MDHRRRRKESLELRLRRSESDQVEEEKPAEEVGKEQPARGGHAGQCGCCEIR